MREAGATRARLKLRDLFSKEKAARGFDIDLAIKSSKSGWVLGAAVGFTLEPFYPPTARIGTAGWLVVALLALCTGVCMYVLTKRPERVTRGRQFVRAAGRVAAAGDLRARGAARLDVRRGPRGGRRPQPLRTQARR